jgi:hypothetical protein
VPSDGPLSIVITVFIAFIVIFVIALIVKVSAGIWKAVILRRGGLNPLVAEEQLAARLNQSLRAGPPAATTVSDRPAGPDKPAGPEKSKEARLSEVTDLHERGLISDAELAEARAKIIIG